MKTTNYIPDYVYWYLKGNKALAESLASGTTFLELSGSKAKQIPIPLAPYDEQNRIVSGIEELFTRLDAGIESLKQVQTLLKKYRQSVLKSAVEGKLTSEFRKQHKDELEPADKLLESIQKERKEKWEAEQLANFNANGKKTPKNWQNKYKEPTPPDTSKLPELPNGWVWVSLETISDALGGFAFKSKDYSESGYQIIKIGNVKMNRLDVEKNPSFIDKIAPEIIQKYLLKKKDILITLTGTRRKRDYGFIAMVKDEKYLLLNQRVGRLKFTPKVKSEYYLIALQSEEFRDRLFSGETGNVGQGNIGMRSITKEAIPLPPIREQEKIVSECERHFSIIDESEKILESELIRSQSLRHSILKRAFEGKLVPQDPNDEPASVLLGRIKAEKSN